MGFDLADILKNVSDPDTGREQIEYIPLDMIAGDRNNFYALSGVADLAANISLVGLQQPLRVRRDPDVSGRYLIVSGHRRFAALALLRDDDPEKWTEAPCIVEAPAASSALQQLRLIYANANTRTLTSAEIGEQAAQVEKLLYQLQSEGYEFPGRMRDHVAEAVGASTSKLARIKVIRNNLVTEWLPPYRDGTVGESTAYALAQLPASWQKIIYTEWGEKPKYLYESSVKAFSARFNKIVSIRCPEYNVDCPYAHTLMRKSCKDNWVDPCACGCCLTCPSLIQCRSRCDCAAEMQTRLKSDARAAQTEQARREQERVAPKLDKIRGIYRRLGIARADAGVSSAQLLAASHNQYVAPARQEELEMHPESIKSENEPILGRLVRLAEVEILVDTADLLGVSLDWLFGRPGYPRTVSGSDPE